ncbi:MAG: hypothetical protein U5N86_11620 [Planctomycetota bacterium]|nr:hypothetical protein [Planctomycetota bacterium]
MQRFFPNERKLVITDIRFGSEERRRLKGRAVSGSWYALQDFAFLKPSANNMAPRIRKLTAPFEDSDLGEILAIYVDDPSNGTLMPEKASYFIDGKMVRFDNQILSYDPVHRRIEFLAARAGIGPGDHTLSIKRLQTSAGGMLDEWSGNFTVNPEKDVFAPSMKYEGALISKDFEGPPIEVWPAPEALPLSVENFDIPYLYDLMGAGVVLRYGDAFRGVGYARVYSRDVGGPFGLGLLERKLDLRYCPLFTCRIRVRERRPLPLSLVMRFEGRTVTVPLDRYAAIGPDWTKLYIDLTPHLPPEAVCSFIGIADDGYQGIIPGEYYDLDAVRFMKPVRSDNWPRLRAYDLSGQVKLFAGRQDRPTAPSRNSPFQRRQTE